MRTFGHQTLFIPETDGITLQGEIPSIEAHEKPIFAGTIRLFQCPHGNCDWFRVQTQTNYRSRGGTHDFIFLEKLYVCSMEIRTKRNRQLVVAEFQRALTRFNTFCTCRTNRPSFSTERMFSKPFLPTKISRHQSFARFAAIY